MNKGVFIANGTMVVLLMYSFCFYRHIHLIKFALSVQDDTIHGSRTKQSYALGCRYFSKSDMVKSKELLAPLRR